MKKILSFVSTFIMIVTALFVLSISTTTASRAYDSNHKQITVKVGTTINWQDYFTVEKNFKIWNPRVCDNDSAGYAVMSGENIIVCKKPGKAYFTVALGHPDGGGYACFLDITILSKNSSDILAIFGTSKGEFSNGLHETSKVISNSTYINASDCPNITKSDYKFYGWRNETTNREFYVNNKVELQSGCANEITAMWTEYKILLNTVGGNCSQSYVAALNNHAIGSLPTPTRSGYQFDGWFTGDTQWTAETVFNAETDDGKTLYAHWTKVNQLISVVNISGLQSPKIGEPITTSNIVLSEGVRQNYDLYWTKKSSQGVYYKTSDTTFQEGGDYGFFITLRAEEDYEFANPLKVYLNGMPADVNNPAPLNYTVSVKFPTLPKKVTVSLDPAGGLMLQETKKTVMSDDVYGSLPRPSRRGYAFFGWIAPDELGGKKVTSATNVLSAEDHTLTAKWLIDMYYLKYDLDGGSATNESAYTCETPTFTLNNPTKDGYTFIGWTGTDLDEMTMTVTIEQGSIGARSYTAHWKADSDVSSDENPKDKSFFGKIKSFFRRIIDFFKNLFKR